MLQINYVIEVRDGSGEIARVKGETGAGALFGGTNPPTMADIERCIDSCEGDGLVAYIETTYVKAEETMEATAE